jgi:hypothetical protein
MKRPLMGLAALVAVAGEASAAAPLDDVQLDALSGAFSGPPLSPAVLPAGGEVGWLPSDQFETINLISLPIPGQVTAALARLGFGAISPPW